MSRTSNCFDVESKRSPLCEKQPVLVYGVLCLNERAHLCILYSSSRPYKLQLNGDETNQIDRNPFFPQWFLLPKMLPFSATAVY